MSTRGKSCLLVLLGITMVAAASQATSYSITEIGTLGYPSTGGGLYTELNALNNNGEIVGRSLTAEGQAHAFLYSNGIMKDLGTLGGDKSIAFSINDHGDVVGGASTSGNMFSAFLFSNETMQDIGDLGVGSTATGISNSGLIVGNVLTADNELHVFSYSNGTMQDIGTFGAGGLPRVNALGEVSGTGNIAGSLRAFLYKNGLPQNLGTFGDQSFANDLNDSGQVVGSSFPTPLNSSERAFIYSDGIIQDLGNLQGVDPALNYFSRANGINNQGQVVGSALYDDAGDFRAFLYSEGIMMDLNTLIADSSWHLTQAYDINDVGQIIGMGRHNDVLGSFLLTPGEALSDLPREAAPVPEPSAVLLLVASLTTMWLFWRKVHHM